MAAISKGVLFDLKRAHFSEFAAKWLTQYARAKVKASTLLGYESMVENHLKPFFGEQELRNITPEDCQRFVASKLGEGRIAPKTVLNIVIILKAMFTHAVRWRYLAESPARFLERPRVERKEMDYLRPHEVRLFLQNADPRYRTLFLTAILTGMRNGELLALRWSDIDWAGYTIHVRRSLYRGSFVTPKSKYSRRAIVITPLLEKALREAWVTHRESEYELIFATGKGTPLDPPTLRKRHFLRALHRSGLRQVRFHDLRHTYAALMISQGENIKFIQSQLGHASIQTTLDQYGHLLPGVSAGVGMRLDESVFGESVSKMLAESPSLDSPRVGEPPESFISQGIGSAARPRG